MDKVLIIGSQGNLGIQLQKIFATDFLVTAWDKENLDITDNQEVNKKIIQLKPDIIINAAAYNAVDKCEKNEKEFEKAKKINGVAVGYLAKIAHKISAVFIHYSTDYVFDGQNKKGYNEESQINPINNYGQSKLLGEKLIKKNNNDNNLKYYIIRTSKLFGPPIANNKAKKSFFAIILEIIKNKKELKVVNEELSLFTFTPDLAKATKELLKEKNKWGIYHIANQGSCTWYKATQYLLEILKKDVKIIPVSAKEFPRLAKRPKYSVLLNTKLRPMRSWQDTLKDYLKSLDI